MTHSPTAGTTPSRGATVQTVIALFAILSIVISTVALITAQPTRAATIPSVLALTELCPSDNTQILWAGSNDVVLGNVHSNAGMIVSGSTNSVTGTVTYDDDDCAFEIPGSSNTGGLLAPTNADSISDPAFAQPTVEECTFTFTGSGDIDLNSVDEVWEADDITLKSGNYCHLGTGKLQQSRQFGTGTVSFFANGYIDLSAGSNVNYTPFRADGVLTHSLANSVDGVTLAGSNSIYGGIVYVPNGEAEAGGQNNTIGCLVGETVKIDGSNNTIGTNCGAEPSAPVLELTKTNNTTGAVAPGTAVNFTITVDVTNGPAAGSIIKDVLPVGYDAPTAISDSGGYTAGDRTITWGPLSVVDGDTFTYTAAVSATAEDGDELVNVAVITSPGTNCPPILNLEIAGVSEDDPCDDDSTVTVVVVPPAPSVVITKTNNAVAPVAPGTAVNYTLTFDVTNGPVPLMTVVDQLPPNISNATAVSNGGSYDLATNRITWTDLANVADDATLTYTATVSASAPAGTHTNTATITEGPCTGDGCDDTSDVVVVVTGPTPTVTISKTNNAPAGVEPGTAVNFTLTFDVTNGPVPAMTVVDQLPAALSNATAISDGGSYNAGTNRITWNLTNVADNATLTYTATVSAGATPGTHTNTVTITVGPCVGAGCVDTSTITVPGGSALGGNPTPTPRTGTVPNTAIGTGIGGEPIVVPVGLLAASLLVSLGALAWANVRSNRRR